MGNVSVISVLTDVEYDKSKFGERYRKNTHRKKGWNYCRNGDYFITINTECSKCWFGEIVDRKMMTNDFGKIVNEQWLKSFEMRDEFFLDRWVLMPNHLHAIVTIDSPYENILSFVDEYSNPMVSKIPVRASNSISSFLAGFKSVTTTKIDNLIDEKGLSVLKFNRRNRLWQVNYNDRVIRNKTELFAIRNYIKSNPAKWRDDQYHPESLD